MHRIALYSDIHGNLPALEAVLADIAEKGVEERYCLGDLVGYGPEPAAVLARVRATGDVVIRGNYDDGVGARRGSCGCYYATEQARIDGDASYAFTDTALDDADHDYLATLRSEYRFESAGFRVLLVHGSPRRINEYLLLDRPDDHLARLAEDAEADVICFGHIHAPYHRAVATPSGTAHFVSDGSVGKPKDGDPRACWAELALDETAGIAVTFHRVAYDIESVAEKIFAAGLPARFAQALRTG